MYILYFFLLVYFYPVEAVSCLNRFYPMSVQQTPLKAIVSTARLSFY